MEQYYSVLGLHPGASEEEVLNAYRSLASQYNPDYFADEDRKKWAMEKTRELNEAFDRVMNYIRRGNVPRRRYRDDRTRFYSYVRRLIQQGNCDTAINQLKAYNNEGEAEWQFLMGTALYYGGYISRSYEYFRNAVNLDPTNREYSSVYGRMQQSRTGNMDTSPYDTDYSGMAAFCRNPCTLCNCLICTSFLRK